MSDYFQDSQITTFHKLGNRMSLDDIENTLRNFSKARPVVLIIPSLYSELSGPALPNIVEELKGADYLKRIVVSLDGANKNEFDHAKEFFGVLPQEVRIVWNGGRRVQEIMTVLEKNNIPIGPQGKGRGAWMAFGYVLARRDSYAIALHDADIVTYERSLLARLIFPLRSMPAHF